MAAKPGKSSKNRIPVTPSRWQIWAVVSVLAITVLFLGYKDLGATGTRGANHPTIHEPALPKSGFAWNYQAYGLKTGHPQYFIRGSKVTVVMLMASWCLYCAYVDKYVWPSIIHTQGLALNIVDISSLSGIGVPGPKNPAFSGHDNVGPVVNVTGLRRVMSRYVQRFQLTEPNVHAFVDPAGLTYWQVQSTPTLLFINAKGTLVKRVNGAVTSAEAQQIILSIEKGE